MRELSIHEIEVIKTRKEKSCRTCGVPKQMDEFGKNPAALDGKTSECLACQRKQQAIIRMGRKIMNYV
jgi:hypothetical protein